MWDNVFFEPEKFTFQEFKMVKGQVDAPEQFDPGKVEAFLLDNSLQLGFNLEQKLVKADFTVDIKSVSKGANQNESHGIFHLVFIYHIDNLEELATPDKNNLIQMHPALGNALSSLTYSTARGILMIKLQGTALQNFVLPVINPNSLLHK
jgi:hypothetical protein